MDQFKRFVALLEKKEAVEKEMMGILANMEKADLAANTVLLRAHAADSKELGKALTRAARTKMPAKRGRPVGSKNKPVAKARKVAAKKPVSKKLASKKPVSKKPVSKKPVSKKPIRRVAPVSLAGSKLPTTSRARSHHKKTVVSIAHPQVAASQVVTDPTSTASQS